jgi:alkylation response protein AidB-like acyl-CoA dehydrogenase
MDFNLSEERQMLADTAARFIADRYDLKKRQAAFDSDEGFSRETWGELADLGLIGALMPPEVEGFGGVGEDIAVVFEALGKGLVVEPFLASGVLGAAPIYLAGSDEQKSQLAEVIAGSRLLALAHGEPAGRYHPTHVATRAERSADDGWSLTGQKAVVFNGDTADSLIVSARTSGNVTDADGITLFVVPKNADGLSRRAVGTVDGSRVAEVALAGVQVPDSARIGEVGGGAAILEEATARGVLALCAEAVGIMGVMHDATLDYLKTRKQFGRAIGAFQVLQHRFVDMVIEIEQARSATMLAASLMDSGDRLGRERAVSAAKNLIGRVGRLVAEECIQMHGGIAMTWEFDLPHYAKRLVMIDHQLGDEDYHLNRFTALGQA